MRPQDKVIWFGMGGLLIVGLLVNACSGKPEVEPKPYGPPAYSAPKPATEPRAPTPVSAECKSVVKKAERNGLVRAGSIDRSGAVILTDARWAKMDFSLQERLAVCLSHYLAGGQDKWVTKITFRNQVAGVTYGTMKNTRYTVQQ